MDNPWQVDSLEEFAYLKCPECIFNTKKEDIFQDHAVKNHPLSHVLFGTTNSIKFEESEENLQVTFFRQQ